MGGDHAPVIVLDGMVFAAERHPGARFLLLGDEEQLAPLVAARKTVAACCTLRHAPTAVSSDMKPTAALRLRHSSMRLAIDAVAPARRPASSRPATPARCWRWPRSI